MSEPKASGGRASWDDYFMAIARVVSSRSTCDRKFVGAVVVRNRTILSTGYNGSIRGLPHCSETGHMMENGHCVATVHAEANAIIQAAKNGVRIDGATIYTTASPCWPCFKLIANAGCDKDDILHSGQSQFTDMVGAKPLGLTVAWINRRGVALHASVPKPDHTFPDLKSLLGLVQTGT